MGEGSNTLETLIFLGCVGAVFIVMLYILFVVSTSLHP
jgi:hypothetical protein